MKKNILIFLLGLLNGFLPACHTASKSETKNKQNIESAIKKLERQPGDPNNITLVRNIYNAKVNDHRSRIEQLIKEDSLQNTERILSEYLMLQQLTSLIQVSLPASRILRCNDYSAWINSYKEKIAADCVQKGLALMSNGDKVSCREASREFKKALSHQPGNPEIEKKLQESISQGVLYVEVLPENKNGLSFYTPDIESFYKLLINDLSGTIINPFVVILADRKSGQDLLPDETIILRFTRLDIGTLVMDKNTTSVDNNNNTVQSTSGRRSTALRGSQVTSPTTITTSKNSMLSYGNLLVTIMDPRGNILKQEELMAQHEWNSESSSYTGDRRNLTANEKGMLNNSSRQTPPSKQEIISEILRQLQVKAFTLLKERYSKL